MAPGEEGIVSSHVPVESFQSTELEHAKPRSKDFFRFDVTAVALWDPLQHTSPSSIFQASTRISCKRFYEDNGDSLRSFLLDPQFSPYFTIEDMDLIMQRIMPLVQELFGVQSLPLENDNEYADSVPLEFPVVLSIILDTMGNEESEAIEESMQHSGGMIPASNEAIQLLKTYTTFPPQEECNICLEKFEGEECDEDVKLSQMPCGHVFHHPCIVPWLLTSHLCPLCRFPMPTQ
ncbi:E3 ubiquitin-protein ligase ZNRF3-like [Abrus precatorius]|uniref:RING-type E3 ubiquitin transferase n=1 Tax=Abrus precatorius TaxID=3816 RepID=A0A8B8KX00_ABRPR|nr:E3 ubiquitin-protein ligase ZNRF3-like [Abrus precatorius]